MSDSEEEIVEKQFKLLLVGDPQIGKTSMCARYAKETFSKQYAPTVIKFCSEL
jgi:GTPase SAR1 family protein